MCKENILQEAAGSCKSLAADEDHDSNEGEKSHGEAAAKEDDLVCFCISYHIILMVQISNTK